MNQYRTEHGFLVLLVAGFACVATAQFATSVAGDSYFCLFFGRDLLANGLPHVNDATVLGYGEWWINAQWMAHVVFYGVYELGGFPLSLILVVGLEVIGVIFAVRAAMRGGTSTLRVLMAAMMGHCMLPTFSVMRAQAFGWLFLGVAFWLIVDDDERPSRRYWWSVPLVVLWTNVHGSALVGAGFLGLGALISMVKHPEIRKERFFLGACIAGASLVSPYWLPPYWLKMTTDAGPFGEWFRPTFEKNPIELSFAILALVGVLFAFRRMKRTHAIMLVAAAVIGLQGVRYGLVVAFGLIAFGPNLFEALLGPRRMRVRRAAPFAVVASILWFVGLGMGLYRLPRLLPKNYPPAILAWPMEGGNIMAKETYGDWLLYERPDLRGRILVDVRSEVATYEDWVTLIHIENGDVDRIEELPDVRHLVVSEIAGEKLVEALEQDARWRRVTGTDAVSLWTRSGV
ncbi:MAG: hypothetical protein AAGE52_41960 [Myxococcota bacterium]